MQSDKPRTDKPLILLTNDDGVRADGLKILALELEEIGQIVVCAPAEQQSAVGHGITLGVPLRVREVASGWHAVEGRPADAVFLGASCICDREPDLVVSGINHGPNLGVDVLYSGTVAAATEASIRGIPALAVSQVLPEITLPEEQGGQKVSPWHAPDQQLPRLTQCLRHTASFARKVATAMLADPPPAGTVVNLNGPVWPAKKYRWTRLGQQFYRACPVRRVDPRGIPYYWVHGERSDATIEPGSDVHAVMVDDEFSLTLLTLDRSADPADSQRAWDLEFAAE
jgi:5'-nucleotidase